MQKNKSIIAILVLALWTLLRSRFYMYIGFEGFFDIFRITDKIVALIIVAYSLSEVKFAKDKVTALVAQGFVITIFFNIVFWQSNIISEVLGFTSIFGFFSFYFLIKNDVDIKIVEKFLIFFAIIYMICWFIAIVNVPTLIFGEDLNGDLSNVDRGFYRFWIPDKELFPILLFYFLGKFLTKNKLVYILLSIVMYILIICHVGRQMITWAFVSSVIMIMFTLRKRIWIFISALCLTCIICIWIYNNIQGVSIMFEMTQTQTSDISNDPRILAVRHYLFNFPVNPISFLWGNGISCEGTELSTFTSRAFKKGYFIEDIGFVGMYIKYGVWMVILMLCLLVKIFKMKVDKQYVYLKYYIAYIYGMFVWGHALTTNILYVMAAYYILYTSNRNIINQRL